jgi:hypothetical protein
MSSVLKIAHVYILCFTNISTYIKLMLRFFPYGHALMFTEAQGCRFKHDKDINFAGAG